MASLVQVKTFFQSGKHGRPLPLAELKELTEAERQELCDLLDEVPVEERSA